MRLTDNQRDIEIDDVEREILQIYERVGDKTLSDLEDEPGFFVFGEMFRNAEDFTEKDKRQAYILKTHWQKRRRYLRTGNVMGFIGCQDERLSITSRFANGERDYFLQYLLRKVLDLPNFIDMPLDGDPAGQMFDWAIALFQKYLRDAMRKGPYKQYVVRRYNDGNLRGTIDIPRHIAKNTPFVGNVAYSRREFSFDNSLTQLIRHTIEYIRKRENGSLLLAGVKDEISFIVNYTPGYRLSDRRGVIEANLRSPVVNAFFWEYRILQRLCLMILQRQTQWFSEDNRKAYGILFDGAWLWEEYLNKLIGDRFFHSENKSGKGAQVLMGSGGDVKTIYPDFISRETPRIIADAKYKPLENIGGGPGGDYYQLLTYMLRFDAGRGYFLYPESGAGEGGAAKREYRLYSGIGDRAVPRPDAALSKLGLRIPEEAGSYDDFAAEMERNERDLLAVLDGDGAALLTPTL